MHIIKYALSPFKISVNITDGDTAGTQVGVEDVDGMLEDEGVCSQGWRGGRWCCRRRAQRNPTNAIQHIIQLMQLCLYLHHQSAAINSKS